MAVTGTNNFTVTRDDLIKAVLRNIGKLGRGATPTAEDYTNCSQALNIMIKSWAKKSVVLWVTVDIPVPMVTGVGLYPIGPTAGYVHSVTASGGSGYPPSGTWTATNGTTGTAASGTYVATAGVITSMTVVVPGDSYTSAPTAFTVSGGGVGATFTATIVGVTTSRPLKLIEGTFIRNAQGYDTQLQLISRQEWDTQGSKTTQGIPNQVYYDNQLPNAYLNTLSVPVDSTQTIHLQAQRQFYDMTAGTDNFDFPQEWFRPLKKCLSAEIATEYGVPASVIQLLMAQAAQAFEDAFDSSQEDTSVFFQLDSRMTMGRR